MYVCSGQIQKRSPSESEHLLKNHLRLD
jgi:hypothetical protein